ncbi:hypothetical protein PFLG_02479 [Plasmodium falciparum RAJ116]|uniref:Uncharacterized protein n=2 Tax=Plasmodium falciparum TaxID=5833 RepID=A0A0L0D0F4_PLAFA|nr:hypothetical protein PFLG_02479 [Plasmodium falciparum RAJ116]
MLYLFFFFLYLYIHTYTSYLFFIYYIFLYILMYIINILMMFFTLFMRAEKRCNKLKSYPFFLNHIIHFNKLTKNNCFNKYKNKSQPKYHIKSNMEKHDSPFIVVYVTTPSKEVAEKVKTKM